MDFFIESFADPASVKSIIEEIFQEEIMATQKHHKGCRTAAVLLKEFLLAENWPKCEIEVTDNEFNDSWWS